MSGRSVDGEDEEELLLRVRGMVPAALEAAAGAEGYARRWKGVAGKVERLPACLSDLSSLPCFGRSELCREVLQSLAATLAEAAELGARLRRPPRAGKLQTRSPAVRTGVLSDDSGGVPPPAEASSGKTADVRDLLARLQIGYAEAKGRAVDGLLAALGDDEKSVVSALGRANVSAVVQLLTAPATSVREKAAAVICQLAEYGGCEGLLVSEGAQPPLIRLAEFGSLAGREKAVMALQRLSVSPDVARAIAGHGGARALIEVCRAGDPIS